MLAFYREIFFIFGADHLGNQLQHVTADRVDIFRRKTNRFDVLVIIKKNRQFLLQPFIELFYAGFNLGENGQRLLIRFDDIELLKFFNGAIAVGKVSVKLLLLKVISRQQVSAETIGCCFQA